MKELPNCPKCGENFTYEDESQFICPMCNHFWKEEAEKKRVYKDSNGNELSDGDSVIVIKDLKIKGTSLVVKKGTKVKKIRLVDEDHDINCKIDKLGAVNLKTEFVKKI